MNAEEVGAMLRVLPGTTPDPKVLLGVGVLMSAKTLYGAGNRHPNRYPPPHAIPDIFPKVPSGSVNLVHYAVPNNDEWDALKAPILSDQLCAAFEAGGPMCHGIQVNAKWPAPDALRKFVLCYPKARVVLQVDPTSDHLEAICERIRWYGWIITDVLLDASGGRGTAVANYNPTEVALTLRVRLPMLGIGLAGGLCAAELKRNDDIRAAIKELHGINLDAEGRLRTAGDHLDQEEAASYLRTALELHRKNP